jgi:hypothetical protein
MPKTDASVVPHPNCQSSSEPLSSRESALVFSQGNACPPADSELISDPSAIAALRAFFELLDRWDRESESQVTDQEGTNE